MKTQTDSFTMTLLTELSKWHIIVGKEQFLMMSAATAAPTSTKKTRKEREVSLFPTRKKIVSRTIASMSSDATLMVAEDNNGSIAQAFNDLHSYKLFQ